MHGQIVKQEVEDRNNPGQLIQVNRYRVNTALPPTPVILGKFDPWTGPNGHSKLLDIAKTNFAEAPMIVSPYKMGKGDLFTRDQKNVIIEKETGIKPIISKSSLPIAVLMELVHKGVKRPVFISGEDRRSSYFNRFSFNECHVEVGKGEQFIAKRDGESTSATKVRKSLIDANEDLFYELTGYTKDKGMYLIMKGFIDGW